MLSPEAFGQNQQLVESPPAAPQPDTNSNRILWIIPNFRTTGELRNYQPISAAAKFKIARQDTFDRGTIALAGLFAGEAQFANSDRSFGQGVGGYAHYAATSYADFAVGNYMTEAVFPVLLHQDPRYFRRGHGRYTGYGGFGNLLLNLFDSHCPNTFQPMGPRELNGKQTLQFRVDAEPDTCFGIESDYQAYRPRIEGYIFLENPGARLVQFEYKALNVPESFLLSSWVRKVSWGDVRIGDKVFLLPVSADLVAAHSLKHGSRHPETEHIVWEYRNHRHFETESSITFH